MTIAASIEDSRIFLPANERVFLYLFDCSTALVGSWTLHYCWFMRLIPYTFVRYLDLLERPPKYQKDQRIIEKY